MQQPVSALVAEFRIRPGISRNRSLNVDGLRPVPTATFGLQSGEMIELTDLFDTDKDWWSARVDVLNDPCTQWFCGETALQGVSAGLCSPSV